MALPLPVLQDLAATCGVAGEAEGDGEVRGGAPAVQSHFVQATEYLSDGRDRNRRWPGAEGDDAVPSGRHSDADRAGHE
jgi:hypothetical protein